MTDKSISRYLKLKDNHPTMIKLMKLWALADELGITISFGSCVVLEDRDRDPALPHLLIEDVEDSGNPPKEFPFATEFKVTYDNPAHLAQQKKELEDKRSAEEAERKAKEETAKLRAEAKKLEDQEKQKQLAKEKEKRERILLTELKSKYES